MKKLSDPFVPGVKKGGALGVKRVAGWVKKSVTRGKRECHQGQKCPFSIAKKWHFGRRNEKTKTTF